MSSNIIVTTPEELKAIVQDAVSSLITKNDKAVEPDTITLDKTVELLEEHGFPTSRAKLYKLTSKGEIPHKKYGHKLVFSRKEILNWVASRCVVVGDASEAIKCVVQSAQRKR